MAAALHKRTRKSRFAETWLGRRKRLRIPLRDMNVAIPRQMIGPDVDFMGMALIRQAREFVNLGRDVDLSV